MLPSPIRNRLSCGILFSRYTVNIKVKLKSAYPCLRLHIKYSFNTCSFPFHDRITDCLQYMKIHRCACPCDFLKVVRRCLKIKERSCVLVGRCARRLSKTVEVLEEEEECLKFLRSETSALALHVCSPGLTFHGFLSYSPSPI